MPRVALCVCTCRRPKGLRRLLEAVAELDYDGDLVVIVVDNDPAGQGVAICSEISRGYRWPLRCAAEEQPGISFARNRAVATALKEEPDYVAMLDDDEWPTRGWLRNLLRIQSETGADVVGGPVLGEFLDAPQDWIRRGRFFDHDLGQPDGALVRLQGSGNFLANACCFWDLMPYPFAPEFALSGGEDAVFFGSLAQRGFAMRWAAHATVFEAVPPSRMTTTWLRQRAFRKGNVDLAVQRMFAPGPKHEAIRASKTVALIVTGALLFCLVWPQATWRVRATLMICRGLGKIAKYRRQTHLEYAVIHGS